MNNSTEEFCTGSAKFLSVSFICLSAHMNNNQVNNSDDGLRRLPSSRAVSVTSPGELFANIPGLLGFYPQESVIFITLTLREGSNQMAESGPIIRMDLDELQALPEVQDIVHSVTIDYVIALIISERCHEDAAYLQRITDCLLSDSYQSTLPIQWIWHTSAIFFGNSFHLVYDHDQGDSTVFATWNTGTIPSITAAPATQDMVARGELPELNRQDCLDYFSPVAAGELKDSAPVFHAAAAFIFLAETKPEVVKAELAEITEICKKVESGELAEPTSDHHHKIAVVLSRTALRDLFLNVFCAHPEAGKQLSLAAARNYQGVIRNNALCVYAMCNLATDRTVKTFHALVTSQQHDPSHRLTSLLLTAYQAGVGEKILAAIKQGALATYDQFGLQPPNRHDGGQSQVA